VPLIVLVAVSDNVFQDDVMLDPGAATSTQVPKFERRPRVRARRRAGSDRLPARGRLAHAFALLLPAAIA
jgi:hypothetical protein